MPKSPEQCDLERDKRRDQIMMAALRIFSSKGLAATRVSDIAKEAAMSQGLLYRYFASKDEIFVELLRNALAKMCEASTALSKSEAPADQKIRSAISQLLLDIERKDDFVRSILLVSQATLSDATPDEAKVLFAENSNTPYSALEKIFADGIAEGTIKDHSPKDLAILFWIIIKGLAMHRAAFADNYTSPDMEIILGNFLKMETSRA